MRVLIIEDEEALASAIARGLRREGMAVDVSLDGAGGLEKALVTAYDVVVLDRNLPGLHGDEVCRRLAGSGAETRILMLTAARGLRDKVAGLNLGADDYLGKPFAFEELVARVRALSRRAGPPRPPVLRRRGVELDPASRRTWREGREIALTNKEFGVLEALLAAERRRRVGRGAAREGLGRERRPVLERRASDHHDVAQEARRAAAHRDGRRRRVPAVRPGRRTTVRQRALL